MDYRFKVSQGDVNFRIKVLNLVFNDLDDVKSTFILYRDDELVIKKDWCGIVLEFNNDKEELTSLYSKLNWRPRFSKALFKKEKLPANIIEKLNKLNVLTFITQ